MWVNSYDALLRSWLSVRNKELLSPGTQFTLVTSILALSVVRQNQLKATQEEESQQKKKPEQPKQKQDIPNNNTNSQQQQNNPRENQSFPYY